jgi:NADH:ubiquinone oxidoreductase subunit 6 (subunit J)
MVLALLLIALFTLGTAAVAMTLRNLIHSSLLLIGSWAGIAAFYLWAGAEFIAFAQILVYVGAISMVVLFAVLLTRQSQNDESTVPPATLTRIISAITVGACVAAVLAAAILTSTFRPAPATAPNLSVKQIGLDLMNEHGATLLIVGVILTVALLGATILAATDGRASGRASPPDEPFPPDEPSSPKEGRS